MSERGSFVTEFIYCKKCFEAAKKVFFEHPEHGKYLWPNVISNWGDDPAIGLPIIAGKIGELYRAGELVFFENEIKPLLEEKICHPLRVAVLCDSNNEDEIFRLQPTNKSDATE